MEIVTCPGKYLCSATGLKWCCVRYDRILKCFRLKIFIRTSTKIQVLTCLNDMQPLPLLQLVKNGQFFVHENLCLTHKQTQMKMRILSLVSVQLWVLCYGFWWNKRKLRCLTHCSRLRWIGTLCTFVPVSVQSLELMKRSHQTAEWDQMILTTGKYLWAEKSNSGSAWRYKYFLLIIQYHLLIKHRCQDMSIWVAVPYIFVS